MATTNSIFKVSKRTDQGNYVATFSWVSWDEDHQAWIEQQGEPEVDLGGNIDPNNLNFDLASNLVKLKSGFPATVTFDSAITPWTTTGAFDAYVTQIEANVTQALQDLKTNNDDQFAVVTTKTIELT